MHRYEHATGEAPSERKDPALKTQRYMYSGTQRNKTTLSTYYLVLIFILRVNVILPREDVPPGALGKQSLVGGVGRQPLRQLGQQ